MKKQCLKNTNPCPFLTEFSNCTMTKLNTECSPAFQPCRKAAVSINKSYFNVFFMLSF